MAVVASRADVNEGLCSICRDLDMANGGQHAAVPIRVVT
jgi:hypothetical protein